MRFLGTSRLVVLKPRLSSKLRPVFLPGWMRPASFPAPRAWNQPAHLRSSAATTLFNLVDSNVATVAARVPPTRRDHPVLYTRVLSHATPESVLWSFSAMVCPLCGCQGEKQMMGTHTEAVPPVPPQTQFPGCIAIRSQVRRLLGGPDPRQGRRVGLRSPKPSPAMSTHGGPLRRQECAKVQGRPESW